MDQLRETNAYLKLIDLAKDDGAGTMATLLTHVGWNKPEGFLSIHKGTNPTGRKAFSEVGFPELGPTGVPIHEVLARATRWSAEQGFTRLSDGLTDFLAVTWPDLPNVVGTVFDPADLDSYGVELRYRGATPDAYKAPLGELRAWATGNAPAVAMVHALTHHGWTRGGTVTCRATGSGASNNAARAVAAGDLPVACYTPGEPTGPQLAACMTALEALGAPSGPLNELWDCYCGGAVSDISPASDDVLAESDAADEAEVAALSAQVTDGNYSVADQDVTAKTRGSAQRVFADRVKKNYGWTCALTGIATSGFLVASHIVPWSEDESIRLDPANGICLSTFVDRAFDTGYLLIHDDSTVRVDWDRVGSDAVLRDALEPFDGRGLTAPSASPPNPQFLRRRLGDS